MRNIINSVCYCRELNSKMPLVLLILFSAGLSAYPQNQNNEVDNTGIEHQGNSVSLSVSPNILMNTPNGRQIAGGIKAQVFLNDKFSLDADIVISGDYLHFSTSAIGISLFMIGNSISKGSWFPLATLFLALSFEHFSYRLKVSNSLDIAPYLSIFRYRFSYRHNDPSNPEFAGNQYCFAAGLQVNKYFGRFVFSPYGEYSIGYKDHVSGFNAGVYCGILIPYR